MLYYEDCQAGLGQDFYQRVSNIMAEIARDPLRHPIYEGKISTPEASVEARFSTAISFYCRLRGARRRNARNRCGTLKSTARLLGKARTWLRLGLLGSPASSIFAGRPDCRIQPSTASPSGKDGEAALLVHHVAPPGRPSAGQTRFLGGRELHALAATRFGTLRIQIASEKPLTIPGHSPSNPFAKVNNAVGGRKVMTFISRRKPAETHSAWTSGPDLRQGRARTRVQREDLLP